jgi:type I restriction enzyme R subunit
MTISRFSIQASQQHGHHARKPLPRAATSWQRHITAFLHHQQQHVRSKTARERLAKRFKDAGDEFKIVLVRDMWLTGFDAPCLHTMYLDKPMRGHGFMQAIARVNRVFKDKQGGLEVDYLGLAQELKQALATYTQSGGKGQPTHDINEAVAVLKEKLEICHDLFDGFDYSKWQEQGLQLLPGAMEHILQLDDGKKRYTDVVTAMTKAMSLCGTHPDAMAVREEVAFFQAVRAALVKSGNTVIPRSGDDVDYAIKQIMSKAIVAGGVVDIFEAAGLDKPNIGILDEQFLEEVRNLPQKNLAVELLERLLKDEIKTRGRTNVVQSRSFTDLLEQSINKYHNRAIQTAQVIEELIKLAKEMNAAMLRGEELGLSEDELAFYDALEVNDSAVQVLGDEILKEIAQILVDQVRKNATIDWRFREGARAKLRVIVKRVLKKYGYLPDKQEHAADTVLQQAETLSNLWAA